MLTEILISVAPRETRVAILEDGSLTEFRVEREDSRRLHGDIFLSQVNAVLPGMQAAFVDLGLEKSGFLHISDMVEPNLDDLDDDGDGDRNGGRDGGRGPSKYPPIDQVLRKGQELLVQVSKEPIAAKGARVTSQISLAGRYLVLMPHSDHVGVSRRIDSRAERSRLRELANQVKPEKMGLIVRTVAEGKDLTQFESDVRFLVRLWNRIQKEASRHRAPHRIHQELGLTAGLIRDLFRDEVDSLVLDDRKAHQQTMNYLGAISPEMKSRVKLYTGEIPLFESYKIEGEIEKTLQRRVNLRRGGFIAIDHTEALVAIDVNTGRYRGGRDQEETILRTNLEAAEEIARQLRLRDLGGIVVIDFIDMENEGNRRRVMEAFRGFLRSDRARTKILNVSDLGLVEMTRQRVRPSVFHYMSEPCPYCGGMGQVYSFNSMKVKLERWARRAAADAADRRVRFDVHPDHARRFQEEEAALIRSLEVEGGLAIEVRGDPALGREEIRVYSQESGEEITRRVGM